MTAMRYAAQITVTCEGDTFEAVVRFDVPGSTGREVWRGTFDNMPAALRMASSEALIAEELYRVPDVRRP